MILYIEHIAIEGPEMIGSFFRSKGYEEKTVRLFAGERLPGSLENIDAVVCLGGPMNVYEEKEYPFLKDEDIFIKKVLQAKIPFLGICLGAQLLAKASGGSVIRSLKEEIGWSGITLTPEGTKDPLFKGLSPVMEVFQWHGDMCVVPMSGVLLASSSACPVQALRVGQNAYGLQFHAEITRQSIIEWSTAYAPDSFERKIAMSSRYDEVADPFQKLGEVLCTNFLSIMKATRQGDKNT